MVRGGRACKGGQAKGRGGRGGRWCYWWGGSGLGVRRRPPHDGDDDGAGFEDAFEIEMVGDALICGARLV